MARIGQVHSVFLAASAHAERIVDPLGCVALVTPRMIHRTIVCLALRVLREALNHLSTWGAMELDSQTHRLASRAIEHVSLVNIVPRVRNQSQNGHNVKSHARWQHALKQVLWEYPILK